MVSQLIRPHCSAFNVTLILLPKQNLVWSWVFYLSILLFFIIIKPFKTFTVAKKADCDGIVVMATSDFSRKIFKRLEIDVIAKRTGKIVFTMAYNH